MKTTIQTPKIEQIAKWVEDVPGWTPIDQLYSLYLLARMTSDLSGDLVEVGSWCGRSTVVLSKALEESMAPNSTKLHAVDLFPNKEDWYENEAGDFSFRVEVEGKKFGGYQDQTVWREPYMKSIKPVYEKNPNLQAFCQDNLDKYGAAQSVELFKGDVTLFFEKKPDLRVKFAFLDGDHGYDAVCQDIVKVKQHLVEGAWIVFDDAFSYYDGVDQSINELIINSSEFRHCQQLTRKCFAAQYKGSK